MAGIRMEHCRGARIKNCSFVGGDVGISVDPYSAQTLEVHDGKFIGVRKGIEFRDPPSLFQKLGLPSDTPKDLVIDMLKGVVSCPQEMREQALKSSGLFSWLNKSARAVADLQKLTDFVQDNELVQTVLDTLSSS